jgi:O-acetyl-ADP-ribose deacetylase (regulator of RNase III)
MDPRIIAHIVNDKTPRWGAGFALAIRKKWPEIQREFVIWTEDEKSRLRLGNVSFATIGDQISICHMICQHGYGSSNIRRLRYEALEHCLTQLADFAIENKTSVHMPRIGTGYAGGSWEIISEIIDDCLCRRRIAVTVYDLPSTGQSKYDNSERQLKFGRF